MIWHHNHELVGLGSNFDLDSWQAAHLGIHSFLLGWLILAYMGIYVGKSVKTNCGKSDVTVALRPGVVGSCAPQTQGQTCRR